MIETDTLESKVNERPGPPTRALSLSRESERGCQPPGSASSAPPSVERSDHQLGRLARQPRVREVVQLPVQAEAGDHHVLALAVLLDAGAAVARAEARLLHAADRDLHREVVDERVVDHRGARLEATGHALAPAVIAGE